jgi:hypothetical protein
MVFLATPAPDFLRFRVHPFMSFGPSSEFVTTLHLLTSRNLSAPPWGLFLLRDMSLRGPLSNKLLTLIYVPLSAFLTLSAVCSPSDLAGLFHPTTTSEITLQGFSPIASRFDSSPTRALLPFDASRLQASCLSCAGSWHLVFRALIQLPIRCCQQVFYACPQLDPLLSFQPCGCFSEYLGDAFTPPPFMTFPADSSGDSDSWPSTSQSIFNLSNCLQLFSPFEYFWPFFRIRRDGYF